MTTNSVYYRCMLLYSTLIAIVVPVSNWWCCIIIVMSGYYHQQQECISPYSLENATDSDDETYLQMNQFQDKECNSRNSNIRSNLKNILTLQNSDQPGPCRLNCFASGGHDWSPESGNNKSIEKSARHSKPIVQNYSKWDPTKKASRMPTLIPSGNPPVFPRLPRRASDGPAIDNDQEDYLTFSSESITDLSHGHVQQQQPKRHSPEEPPPRPPRSPARYDDHALPFRLPAFTHDEPPERPPPLPPTQMSPNHSTPPYPSPISRHGSDKSCSSISPGSSRPSSVKDQALSHMKERKTNYSTESSGSTSSDEPGQGTKTSYIGTQGKFVPRRSDRVPPPFKIPPKHRPSLPFTMPSFDPPSAAKTLEEQSYFRNVDRDTAQDAIYSLKQDGAFLVRPRNESSRPYALTLWASDKFYNFIIRQRSSDDKYALGSKKEDEKAFESVENLVEHFHSHEVVLPQSEGYVKLTVSPP